MSENDPKPSLGETVSDAAARVADPDGNESGVLQLIAAILLGLAATMTAVSAYQAALTDGEALQGYTLSNAAGSEANALRSQAEQVFAADQSIYLQYAIAATEGNFDLTEYFQTELMRPELADAVAWFSDQGDDVLSPFVDVEGNPYVVAEDQLAIDKQAEADRYYAEASEADDQGDKFELSTVLLALTLFFGGIATLFRRRSVEVGLLSVATLTLAAGAVQFTIALTA
ncbi:hypothetical protein [Nocardioides sp.]|uniref:hypothetical protein n=1 Tax=Nocardioides sp. TaxID=35761 RepID=UPI003517F32D